MPEAQFITVAGVIALVCGYFCGSIPFGLLIAKAGGKGDVREIGSGNIGATNVLRTGSKGLAALTLAADALKGAVPAIVALSWIDLPAAATAGFGAFLGHLYPVWLGFKGGKGVATYLGVLLGLAWQGAVVFGVVWLVVAALFRYSSLAALIAVVAVPVALFIMDQELTAGLFALLGVMIYFKHRANISRLIEGSETRIGSKG